LRGIPGLIGPGIVPLRGGDPTGPAGTIEEAGIVRPLIVREARTHTDKTVRLCSTVKEAIEELEVGIMLDGMSSSSKPTRR
jgi:hypothetical protein